MKSVAVVILNYNTKHFLEKFLPSVLASQYSNYTVYVVDNASSDQSVEFVKLNFPEIKIIQFKQNHGFTGGYNLSLKQINADYFILLNSDVEVDKNWIEPLVNLAESNEKIAAIQPKILSYNQKNSFEYAGASGGFIDKYGYPYCRGRIFDTLEIDLGQYDDNRQIFWATGASLFIKSDVYLELGGLDSDFFAHMEEIDLCWRIQNTGKQIWVCPESKVWHVGGGTLDKTNPKKTFLNFRNGLIVLMKNLPANKLFSTILIRLILDHIAAYQFLFKGNVKNFKAIAKAHFEFISKLNKWKAKRKQNQTYSPIKSLPIYNKSIVFQYFIKKIKTYKKL